MRVAVSISYKPRGKEGVDKKLKMPKKSSSKKEGGGGPKINKKKQFGKEMQFGKRSGKIHIPPESCGQKTKGSESCVIHGDEKKKQRTTSGFTKEKGNDFWVEEKPQDLTHQEVEREGNWTKGKLPTEKKRTVYCQGLGGGLGKKNKEKAQKKTFEEEKKGRLLAISSPKNRSFGKKKKHKNRWWGSKENAHRKEKRTSASFWKGFSPSQLPRNRAPQNSSRGGRRPSSGTK